MMMLGDLLRSLDDEAVAEAALATLGDETLVGAVRRKALRDGLPIGETIADAVVAFERTAGPDAWLAVTSAASRTKEPGVACLAGMLREALRGGCEHGSCGGHGSHGH